MKFSYDQCIKDHKLVEIYENEDEIDSFILGYIIQYDDYFILIQCIDKYGAFDGYLAIQIDKIYRIAQDSMYINDMLLILDDTVLNDKSKSKYKNTTIIASIINDCTSLLTIQLCSSGYNNINGFVVSNDLNTMTLKCYDDSGTFDGITTIDMNCITSIEFDSKNTRRIEKLKKAKKQ